MAVVPAHPPYDQFLATAERVAAQRGDVDLDMAREVFAEAAVLVRDGLVLDGLDDHDAGAVVALLCDDLCSGDAGAAIRARAQEVLAGPSDLHDPEGASVALLMAVGVFRL